MSKPFAVVQSISDSPYQVLVVADRSIYSSAQFAVVTCNADAINAAHYAAVRAAWADACEACANFDELSQPTRDAMRALAGKMPEAP